MNLGKTSKKNNQSCECAKLPTAHAQTSFITFKPPTVDSGAPHYGVPTVSHSEPYQQLSPEHRGSRRARALAARSLDLLQGSEDSAVTQCTCSRDQLDAVF